MQNYFKVFGIYYLLLIVTKFLFYGYLHSYFSEFDFATIVHAIFWGYKFDFAVSGVFAFFVTLFDRNKKISKGILLFFTIVIVGIELSDVLYFYESSRHIGYEITDVSADAVSLLQTAFSQHFGFSIFMLLFMGMIFYLVSKVSIEEQTIGVKYFFTKLFLLVLSVFFARGMWQHIPLNPWQSNQIGDAKLASLALNDVYNVVFSLASKGNKLQPLELPAVTQEDIETTLKELYPERELYNDGELPVMKTKPNVVFLFLESWSAKWVSAYNSQLPTITPNFDTLLQKSLHPTLMIANGHRTTEGMFAVLTSFENPLGKSVAKTNLQDNKYTSVIDLFVNAGYSSAFFQGTSKETSGTGSLAQNLGFKYSYGKRDIQQREFQENYWGVQDPDLYNFVLQKLQDHTMNEPFVIGINGATTHDIVTPKGYVKSFVKDEKLNKQLNVFHFSDWAMGEFIEQIQKKYPNTVFVLFADHCGGNLSGTFENYAIPFAVYAEGLVKAEMKDVILSQRDIAPTVVDLVLGDYKKMAPFFSGKSLVSDEVFFAEYYANGILGWIEKKRLVEINLATETKKCYEIDGLQKEKRGCQAEDATLKKHALSFVYLSQKMLFEDRILEFGNLRKEYKTDENITKKN